jgi:hypothetical protein
MGELLYQISENAMRTIVTLIACTTLLLVIHPHCIEITAQTAVNDPAKAPSSSKAQFEEYIAHRPKTIHELQPYRESTSIEMESGSGSPTRVTLVNLNPRINTWYLLTLEREDGTRTSYHIENPLPSGRRIRLDPAFPSGLVITEGGKRTTCDLWSELTTSGLVSAVGSQKTFAPLCDGRLYLRNPTEGRKTTLEWTTDFLRRNIPGGEQITNFVRKTFYQDAFLSTSEITEAEPTEMGTSHKRPPGAPLRPSIDPRYENDFLMPRDLGIDIEYEAEGKVLVGRWYRVRDIPGVFISVIQPQLVSVDIARNQEGKVKPLDEVESAALDYLIAFDLDQFDLGFAMGTEHPMVNWSDRVQPKVRDDTLPGPDGIGTVRPLVNTGKLNPVWLDRVVSTFTGGFKRYHGAFKWTEFSLRNGGSHYGFIEHGVIMSKPIPGLATVIVYADGTVDLKTWTEADDADIPRIRHARQNGLPIIDYDPVSGQSMVGTYVPQPNGNWSGSVEGRFRTLRAGLAIQENGGDRFLIYGYFSTATPSAMARVFEAYRCKYAMLTDMNALEHTYLALYRTRDSQFDVQHLIKGMEVLDKSNKGQVVPRFVGFSDNRDFFYLLRKVKG